jgi:hypothetical protein
LKSRVTTVKFILSLTSVVCTYIRNNTIGRETQICLLFSIISFPKKLDLSVIYIICILYTNKWRRQLRLELRTFRSWLQLSEWAMSTSWMIGWPYQYKSLLTLVNVVCLIRLSTTGRSYFIPKSDNLKLVLSANEFTALVMYKKDCHRRIFFSVLYNI